MESSQAAIMKQVKDGMPNATEVAKKQEGPAAPAGANAPPTPASVLKDIESKTTTNKTESAAPAGATPPPAPVSEAKPVEKKTNDTVPAEKSQETQPVPAEKSQETKSVPAEKSQET